jgi:magnesium-transporting ATPase (P-type)
MTESERNTNEAGGRGLTTQEAKARLVRVGPHEQAPAKRAAGLIQMLLPFANPLVIILLTTSAVSAFVGEIVNATIIALMGRHKRAHYRPSRWREFGSEGVNGEAKH